MLENNTVHKHNFIEYAAFICPGPAFNRPLDFQQVQNNAYKTYVYSVSISKG